MKVAFILLDKSDNYVACCSQELLESLMTFIREEDGKTYQCFQQIINPNGELIAILFKEK